METIKRNPFAGEIILKWVVIQVRVRPFSIQNFFNNINNTSVHTTDLYRKIIHFKVIEDTKERADREDAFPNEETLSVTDTGREPKFDIINAVQKDEKKAWSQYKGIRT